MLNNHSEKVNMDMSIFQADRDFEGAFYRKNTKGRVQRRVQQQCAIHSSKLITTLSLN